MKNLLENRDVASADRISGGIVMRRAVLWSIVLVALIALPTSAQSVAQTVKEAEIKASVSFSDMQRAVPGITLAQYDAAVRELAKRESGSSSTPVLTAPYVPTTPRLSPPSLVGADGTYLGVVSSNPYDPNSISNPYGRYGSTYSATSVNNPYSRYGSPYSAESATNPYATQAPAIVNPYLGHLSANPYATESTSNHFGPYGSPYSPISITNPYSIYGSPFSPSSVTNPFAISPIAPIPPIPPIAPLRPYR